MCLSAVKKQMIEEKNFRTDINQGPKYTASSGRNIFQKGHNQSSANANLYVVLKNVVG